MHIQNMALRDVPAVHQLGKDQVAFQANEKDIFWSVTQLKKWIKSGDDVLLVAKDEGKVVGFALSTFHAPTGKVTWENLFITPAWRGRGAAAALTEELIKQLRAKGATQVCFFVRAEHAEEVEYFESRGFTKGFNFIWFSRDI